MLLSFDRSAGTRQAAQLSFFVLLSFPALMLLAVWILSNIFDSPNVRHDLIQELINNLPIEQAQGKKEIEDMLDQLTQGAGGLGILSIVVLLYSVSSAIGGLRHAVETANEKGESGPPFPKNKVLDIGITLVTLPVALAFVALALSRDLAKVVDDSALLSWTAENLGGPVGIFGVALLFYTWIFWVLNPGPTTWTSAAVGSAVTSLLIWLIYSGLRVWFGISGGGSAVYGALAGFLGLLLFLNLASMAVVLGAHVAAGWRVHRSEKVSKKSTAGLAG
ncbi:MAG: YihY/virulence factor BrkB family protein [Solirubrobacterales bacterium]|nr:YihY/virulence factor BrkB family protein [Solirubrobacterales bacterium]MCB8915130.1 YihY/virulence factor BrkB family protein [Thermoleophilales bacterium]